MLSAGIHTGADVMQALAELAVEEERWEDAQQLVAGHPELAETVCLPWAEWLVAKGSFHEARLAYRYLTAGTLYSACIEACLQYLLALAMLHSNC